MSARSRCCAIESKRSYGIFCRDDMSIKKKNNRMHVFGIRFSRAMVAVICVFNNEKEKKECRGGKKLTKMGRREGEEEHAARSLDFGRHIVNCMLHLHL